MFRASNTVELPTIVFVISLAPCQSKVHSAPPGSDQHDPDVRAALDLPVLHLSHHFHVTGLVLCIFVPKPDTPWHAWFRPSRTG